MANETEFTELSILLSAEEYAHLEWFAARGWLVPLSPEDYIQKILEIAWLNREVIRSYLAERAQEELVRRRQARKGK